MTENFLRDYLSGKYDMNKESIQFTYCMAYLGFLADERPRPLLPGGLSPQEARELRVVTEAMAENAHVPDEELIGTKPDPADFGLSPERAYRILDEMDRLSKKAFARKEKWQ